MNLAAFRREPIRSRTLLDSAKGATCSMRVPNVCNRDPATTVSAHIRDESFGMGVKADDCSSVHACSACHNWLDRGEWIGTMVEADVLRIIIRAMQRTQRDRIERKFMRIDLDRPAPKRDKPTPPRKPKDLRAKVASGRPLAGRAKLPQGRKIQQRNGLGEGK